MKQIRKLWRKLTNAVNNRGMQFLISLSFTFVALVGMAFIGVFLYQSYGRASEDVALSSQPCTNVSPVLVRLRSRSSTISIGDTPG